MCYSADEAFVGAQDDDCTPSLSHHPASSSDVDDLKTIIDRAVENWTVKTGDNQPGEKQKKYLEDPRLSEVRKFIENKNRALNTKDPGRNLTPLQEALQHSIKIVDGEACRNVVRTLIHYFQDQSLVASGAGFRPSLPMQCLTAEKADGEATSFILKSVKLKDVVVVDETETNGATESKTVMHLAVEKKWKRIVELIYSKNKRIVEAVDAQGYTPLQYAKKLKESSKATSLNDIIEFLKSELCLTLK